MVGIQKDVQELLEQVTKLTKQAEEQRKTNTENLKKIQEENAKEWRDVCLGYFGKFVK